MPTLPARCLNPACRFAFPGGGGGVRIEGNATNIRVSNYNIRCPRCHGPAQVMEGRFNVTDGAINMISGPQWSWDLVEELRLTLRQIVEDPPADPIAPIAKVSPALARDLEQVRDKRNLTTREVLTLLAEILGVLGFFGVSADPEITLEIMRQVSRVIGARYGLE